MDSRSIIIIGAGVAGLAAGTYARMNGYSTHIFELHTTPGGLCTAWKRKGYTIDGCIHFLQGCRPGAPFYSVCRELGILQNNSFQIIKHFSSFLDEKTGRSFVVTSDLERLARDMKMLASEDNKTIEEFIGGCDAAKGFTGTPKPELVEFMKGYAMSIAEFSKRFKNLLLRWYITNMLIPDMPMYAMFLILGQLSDEQLGLMAGGSLDFSLAIAKKYQDLQGEITCGAHVEEIIVENNCAAGVRLNDGTVHRADLIVSAADGYSTIFQLLGGRYADRAIRERYQQWPLFTPIHIISFGISRAFSDEPPEKIIRLEEPINTGGKDVDELRLRIFNYDLSLAPRGKTVVQVIIYTDFDHWYHLQENRALYENEKARVAGDVLQRLERIYPGISPLVEMTDVATPYTFWRYTRNHRGSWEGWLPTPQAVRTVIPKTLPGLANFYMAGQWVQPAGGIQQSINSGRDVVRLICAKEGKEFSTLVP